MKFADTHKDKEQKRLAQQLQQQMQQISAASVWGNLAGLNTLGPQYLVVSVFAVQNHSQNIYTHSLLYILLLWFCCNIWLCFSMMVNMGSYTVSVVNELLHYIALIFLYWSGGYGRDRERTKGLAL